MSIFFFLGLEQNSRGQKLPEAWLGVKCCATGYLPGIRPGLKIPCPHTNSLAQTALSDSKLGRITKNKHEAVPDSSFREPTQYCRAIILQCNTNKLNKKKFLWKSPRVLFRSCRLPAAIATWHRVHYETHLLVWCEVTTPTSRVSIPVTLILGDTVETFSPSHPKREGWPQNGYID